MHKGVYLISEIDTNVKYLYNIHKGVYLISVIDTNVNCV